MIKERLPAYPLMPMEPLLSVWSASNAPSDADSVMWTGADKPINGHINVDGVTKRFMGEKGADDVIKHIDTELSLSSTKFTFSDGKVKLYVTFTTPGLSGELFDAARPITYIDIKIESADDKPHKVAVVIDFGEKLIYAGAIKRLVRASVLPFGDGRIGYMGRQFQRTLTIAGDDKETDWGWFYLAGGGDIIVSSEAAKKRYIKKDNIDEEKNYRKILVSAKSGDIEKDKPLEYFLVAAYDDIYSAIYFGDYKKAYWTKQYYNIVNVIKECVKNHDAEIEKIKAFDKKLEKAAMPYGKDYYLVLIAAYRQTLASGKIINVGGEPVYIQKDCGNGGLVNSVFAGYYSAPLFLFFKPELLKGLLIPLFDYARMKSWKFPFSPEDAGLYPYVTGQVTGANPVYVIKRNHIIRRTYYIYLQSKVKNLYNADKMSPADATASTLILSAAYLNKTGDTSFISENADLLSQYAEYIDALGIKLPEELSKEGALDVNLAMKCVIALGAYGKMLETLKPGDGVAYLKTAADLANKLERISGNGEHTAKTIDDRNSWSLKYNLIWDRILGLNLFSHGLYEKEIALYRKNLHKFGVPADSYGSAARVSASMFAAALDDSGKFTAEISAAIAKALVSAKTNLVFPDRYDVITGVEDGANKQNPAVGAAFIKLLADVSK